MVIEFLIFFVVPDVFENGIQADATAYFGSVLTNSTLPTEVFRFRIVIDLSAFDGDLTAILTVMNRNNLVESIFKFSNDDSQRTFTFVSGVIAANASGNLPPEVRLLNNRLVVFEDFIIYRQPPPPTLELPTTLDFDLSILPVGSDPMNSQTVTFAIGTVALIPPPGEFSMLLINSSLIASICFPCL